MGHHCMCLELGSFSVAVLKETEESKLLKLFRWWNWCVYTQSSDDWVTLKQVVVTVKSPESEFCYRSLIGTHARWVLTKNSACFAMGTIEPQTHLVVLSIYLVPGKTFTVGFNHHSAQILEFSSAIHNICLKRFWASGSKSGQSLYNCLFG